VAAVGGRRFPGWVGDTLFQDRTDLPNISGACDFSGPAGAGDGWGKRRAAEAHTTAAGAGVWVGSEVVCAGAAAGVSTHGPRPLARPVPQRGAGGGTCGWPVTGPPKTLLRRMARRARA
jgi:hypothetical protein